MGKINLFSVESGFLNGKRGCAAYYMLCLSAGNRYLCGIWGLL